MQWHSLLQQVRYVGLYATDAEAEAALRAVLTVLGGQLSREERRSLIRLLPHEAAVIVNRQAPLAEPLPVAAFLEAVAARLPLTSPQQARWAAGTVLTLLAQRAGKPLTRRVLARLPRGYALLLGGHTELAPAPTATAA